MASEVCGSILIRISSYWPTLYRTSCAEKPGETLDRVRVRAEKI